MTSTPGLHPGSLAPPPERAALVLPQHTTMGIVDEFLRSGHAAVRQLTLFRAALGSPAPEFEAGTLIDAVSFAACAEGRRGDSSGQEASPGPGSARGPVSCDE